MTPLETGYARALLYAAVQRDSVEKVAGELPSVERLISMHKFYFLNPRVTTREKVAVLRGTLGGQADERVTEFLVLLVQHRHTRLLPGISREFAKLAELALGKTIVRLRIPYQPGGELLCKLREHLAERGLISPELQDGVQFEVIIDKRLIGGFVAEYGGRLLDASVKTRLDRVYHSTIQ